MRRAWFVWKFHRGRYVGCLRVAKGFDAADRLVAELTAIYQGTGWRYEVAETKGPPPVGFVDYGMGI